MAPENLQERILERLMQEGPPEDVVLRTAQIAYELGHDDALHEWVVPVQFRPGRPSRYAPPTASNATG